MSKIIVFGAHGKVGQRLLKLVSASKHTATAVVRNEAQVAQIKSISGGSSKIKAIQFDLALASVKEISAQLTGHDAIVLSVGSGGKDLLKVDLDGVVKAFEAAVEANVRRLILVSAVFAESREFGASSPIHNYYIAKHYADRILIHEFGKKLDYTILKPSRLTDGEGTGKIKFLERGGDTGLVDRADVALVILEILENKTTFGKSYDFANGEEEIGDPETWR